MLTLRPLAAADLDAVIEIQTASPETAQWPAEAWRSLFTFAEEAPEGERQRGYCAWVAQQEGKTVGFLAGLLAGEEMEVLNLAVAPEARRRRVASRLLGTALRAARRAGGHRAFLEVRISNAGAIAFYHRHGFSVSGRRANYYSTPVEDALLLSRNLVAEE